MRENSILILSNHLDVVPQEHLLCPDVSYYFLYFLNPGSQRARSDRLLHEIIKEIEEMNCAVFDLEDLSVNFLLSHTFHPLYRIEGSFINETLCSLFPSIR